jgi:hypothetical protein
MARRLGMHSKAIVERTFFPFGFTAEYSAALDITSPKLNRFTELVIKELLPPGALAGESLLDTKGRDPQELINDSIPLNLKPHTEELLFANGRIIVPSEAESSDQTEAEAREPQAFTVSVNTAFEEFEGASHIRHRVSISRGGALPEVFPLPELVALLQAEISHLRCGIELFRGHFISSMLGWAPSVAETLLIEGGPERIQIKIVAERLERRDSPPLQRDNLLGKLDKITRETLDFKLVDDYLNKVRGRAV